MRLLGTAVRDVFDKTDDLVGVLGLSLSVNKSEIMVFKGFGAVRSDCTSK
jgi:ABC-type proline/glycine betaine transport system ATPase subunit